MLGFVLTLVAHYGWELLQARWYVVHEGNPLRAYAWHCFVAALGDVVIAGVSYALTAAAFHAPRWVLEPRVALVGFGWIVIGLGITVLLEIWATATGRWTYAASMPTILGVGWLPIAQWVIVPSLTLGIFRVMMRSLVVSRHVRG